MSRLDDLYAYGIDPDEWDTFTVESVADMGLEVIEGLERQLSELKRKADLFDELIELQKQWHATKGKENIIVCCKQAKIHMAEKTRIIK